MAKTKLIETLASVLPAGMRGDAARPDDLLLHPREKAEAERFFYRHLAQSTLPVNLYDIGGSLLIDRLPGDAEASFPVHLPRPDAMAQGCGFVMAGERLFVLYDQLTRWPDAPGHIGHIAVLIDPARLAEALGGAVPPHVTPSEYQLMGQMLAGHDLKSAAQLLGARYDTKRKQVQIIMDKLEVRSQPALLRALSIAITALALDEILPSETGDPDTALIKAQFGRDVVVHRLAIGEDAQVLPVWEMGARRGRAVLYFHSMLAPVIFHDDLIARLQAQNLRLLVVPRHFIGFAPEHDSDTRLEKLSSRIAEAVDYLCDAPVLCLGESAGVPWAASFVRRNPDLVAHLFCVATPQSLHHVQDQIAPTVFRDISQRLRSDTRVIAGLTRIYNMLSRVPSLARNGLGYMFRESASDTATLQQMFAQGDLQAWLTLIANHARLASIDEMVNMQRNWLADLQATDCAMTFIHGREDPISPVEEVEQIAATLPQAQMLGLPDGGHLVLTAHLDALMRHLGAQAQ